MDEPKTVGADRIVYTLAAKVLFARDTIVVDLGTATTFDAISKEGDYLGGAIAPGVMVATEALVQRTAKLPRVELVVPSRAIGRNTIRMICWKTLPMWREWMNSMSPPVSERPWNDQS